jgi:hydrophobe/amphiphile efflux-3 (HAE3) family protein
MWKYLIRIILRYRFTNLIVIGILTLLAGYMATKVQMSYEMARMLPASDSAIIDYDAFKKTFGQDGAVMFVGLKGGNTFGLSQFRDYYRLTENLRKVEGVEEVISIARLFNLTKDTVAGKFLFKPVASHIPVSQAECDSIARITQNLPFYNGLLFNNETGVHLMYITLDKEMLNSRARVGLVYQLRDSVNVFAAKHKVEAHFSGLPYIRTMVTKKVQTELKIFTLAALLVAAVLLFFFFRSKKAVLFPLLVVLISLVWAMGMIGLMGFKITILTGIIPPLLIIIGVENCIFLLNKFHFEFREHGNKMKALARVVERVGKANILTNAATAVGFGTFMATGNQMLVEFGIVASLNIFLIFLLSLFLIPIFYSYMPDPNARNLDHLESGPSGKLIYKVLNIVQNNRRWVYLSVFVAIAIGLIGSSRLTTTGRIVDDIPQKDVLYKDLLFLEDNFKGVMPLEISIDTKKPKGVMKLSTIQKIDQLQDLLKKYPELSKPLSIVEVVKFSKQAFYFGNPAMYDLPDNQEKNFILSYLPKKQPNKRTILNAFIDSTMSKTRISVQMANIGTTEIRRISEDLRPRIDSIFPPEKFDVKITGTSVVFLKGTDYLVKDLIKSLILAVLLISFLMAMLFSSWRMILISLFPNLLPQLLTAAMMGFVGIPIKPSTILIFSIALGISVDNTIQFLSRYRLMLRHNNWDIKVSVIKALNETGYSMIYSSTILFFGFGIFIFSSFGGTEAMGYLISFTLLIALFSNLFLLPSLLLWLDKLVTTKAFKEPVIQELDEEKDSFPVEE